MSLSSSFRRSRVSPAPFIPGDPTTFIKNFLPAEAVYDEVSTEVKFLEKIQVKKIKAARKSMKKKIDKKVKKEKEIKLAARKIKFK